MCEFQFEKKKTICEIFHRYNRSGGGGLLDVEMAIQVFPKYIKMYIK